MAVKLQTVSIPTNALFYILCTLYIGYIIKFLLQPTNGKGKGKAIPL